MGTKKKYLWGNRPPARVKHIYKLSSKSIDKWWGNVVYLALKWGNVVKLMIKLADFPYEGSPKFYATIF